MAAAAADGFGAEQVSWVVVHGERWFLRAGDTLWHGKVDLTGRAHSLWRGHRLPGYLGVPRPLEDFLTTARRRNVTVEQLKPGDRLSP